MFSQSRSCRPPAHKWILPVIFLVKAVCDATDSVHTYQWNNRTTGEVVTCDKCPPGTYVASHCTQEARTVCRPCPNRHYTQFWNYVERCRYCNVFCNEREVEARPCSATHNRQCQCQPGYYLDFEFCIEHSSCPPGTGVQTLGTVHANTQCQKCPPGTFSNISSSTAPCRPHRNCQEEGLEVNVEGTQHQDTLCTTCRWLDTNSTHEVSADCEQAVFEYMASLLSRKQLKKLLRQVEDTSVERIPSHRHLDKKAQQKLGALFALLRDLNPHQNFVNKLLHNLSKAQLNRIENAIRKKFFKSNQ
ncbi:tumor necrosis factor receptor superfamily member 6B [Ambystoma mexicanum]|uniref:tumor necrosis factor receptor superfamily member 6B n=1 Tax=Ambystoma mexicanum TaxID=8296 RepID=UPI0037E8ED35